MGDPFYLYFHSACFDGVVSAAITADFLERTRNWRLEQLIPVNYDVRSSWLSQKLELRSAVVDFLYHPEAVFWADHHGTTFLNDEVRRDFEQARGPWMVYDDQVGSCAYLLRDHLARCFSFQQTRYDPMVDWADKIDAARYSSVQEAILGDSPALRIRASLATGEGREFSKLLVHELRADTLDSVAKLPLVSDRADQVRAKTVAGLEHFAPSIRLETGEIAVFDVIADTEVMLSRYAPFHFFPDARYSVGVVRSQDSAKITAMRNPWREFPSVHLGKIFEKTGGGGHQRVASVILSGDRAQQATLILDRIASQIREQDSLLEVSCV
jgi:hypothetical protein